MKSLLLFSIIFLVYNQTLADSFGFYFPLNVGIGTVERDEIEGSKFDNRTRSYGTGLGLRYVKTFAQNKLKKYVFQTEYQSVQNDYNRKEKHNHVVKHFNFSGSYLKSILNKTKNNIWIGPQLSITYIQGKIGKTIISAGTKHQNITSSEIFAWGLGIGYSFTFDYYPTSGTTCLFLEITPSLYYYSGIYKTSGYINTKNTIRSIYIF